MSAGLDERKTFSCHRCGTCCTNLRTLWDEANPRGASRLGEQLYRLPTDGGLRMFPWETDPFDADQLAPLVVAADANRQRLVTLAYELQAKTCPRYSEEQGCTIYPDRPLVCQAYPLLVLESEDGPEVAASATCNARVHIAAMANQAEHPERVLARAYPDAFAPALAVPALFGTLNELLAFLETADVIDPVPDLDPETVPTWGTGPPVDLVTLLEDAGVMDQAALEEQAAQTVATIRKRWTKDASPGEA